MGQGGNLVLINGTPYNWQLSGHSSYQMHAWTFPSTIASGTVTSIYVEWDEGVFKHVDDDSGSATYTLGGTLFSFEIHASHFNLQVNLQNFATTGNALGSTIKLGWKHDGAVYFFLSGKEGHFASTNPPSDWMQQNLFTIGDLPLRQLCIPGSHDAGMSRLTGGTAFVTPATCLTQTSTIGQQLALGSRYLDCRPVISGGQYVSGHYSDLPTIGWQGGNGQSFIDIINDINNFTSTNAELVILNLSHDFNTDVGRIYRSMNQTEWNGFLQQLTSLQHLFIAPDSASVDLTRLPLKQFIGGNKAAVVIIAQPSDSNISLGYYAGRGIYTYSQMDAYNNCGGGGDLNHMAADQLKKMCDNRTSPDSQLFLLSWTLTQSPQDAIVGPSILNLAAKAMPRIFTDVIPSCSKSIYPNILYVDGLNCSDITALAMCINAIATN